MAWLGTFSEQPYIKFIDGSFARATLSNQSKAAEADAVGVFLPGTDLALASQDIASPWTTVAPRVADVPVLQEVSQNMLLKQIAEAKKQKAKAANG